MTFFYELFKNKAACIMPLSISKLLKYTYVYIKGTHSKYHLFVESRELHKEFFHTFSGVLSLLTIWSIVCQYDNYLLRSLREKRHFRTSLGDHEASVSLIVFINGYWQTAVMHQSACLIINPMRQSACVVVYPITINSFAFRFKCMPVGRSSDSIQAPT